MTTVTWVKPTREHIEVLAANMRPDEVKEIWASGNLTPIDALVKGVKASHGCTAAVIDGEPVAILGLVEGDLLSGRGCPWMLTSNSILKHRREVLRCSPPVIAEMLRHCSHIGNYVHADNKISIRWLKWLGFTFEDPAPYGYEGEMFHYFYKESSSV